mgnify:CR=1 FL=1
MARSNINTEAGRNNIRAQLLERLKAEHCLWSYNVSEIQDIPDDMLIELVMLHLDIEDINSLFLIFPYGKVKKGWLENVVVQGERYYNLNLFFSWYYFHAKKPSQYVKAMATRYQNKRISA